MRKKPKSEKKKRKKAKKKKKKKKKKKTLEKVEAEEFMVTTIFFLWLEGSHVKARVGVFKGKQISEMEENLPAIPKTSKIVNGMGVDTREGR